MEEYAKEVGQCVRKAVQQARAEGADAGQQLIARQRAMDEVVGGILERHKPADERANSEQERGGKGPPVPKRERLLRQVARWERLAQATRVWGGRGAITFRTHGKDAAWLRAQPETKDLLKQIRGMRRETKQEMLEIHCEESRNAAAREVKEEGWSDADELITRMHEAIKRGGSGGRGGA